MKRPLAWFGALVVLLACAGCGQKTAAPEAPATVTLVPAAQRSHHFEAVNRHLDLGGTLYIYADVDGDAVKFAKMVGELTDNIAQKQPMAARFLKQDYQKLFATLGLTDIKALGLSSVPATGGGFSNHVFFYTPGGRHGLLAGLGGPAAPFTGAKLAPADTDLYGESEVDLPAVYATIKAVVAQAAGDGVASQMEAKLKEAGAPAGLSALDVIQHFKGRAAVILRVDPKENLTVPVPGGVAIPAFSLLIRVDGVGGVLEKALAKVPALASSQEGTLKIFSPKKPFPVQGMRPVIALDGSTLLVATTKEFLAECRQHPAGLDGTPAFQQALGNTGNGLGYASPRLYARLRQLDAMNPQAQPEVKRVLKIIVEQMPALDRPLVTVRSNEPDGILIRSFSDRSLKQQVALVTVYNPVTIGLMAAMAIPAFQQVRVASQEKAVLNNLRMLHAAAEQYYLENGVDAATFENLVGPGKFIPQVMPVAGEDYRKLVFKQGRPLRIRMSSGKVVEWPVGAMSAPRRVRPPQKPVPAAPEPEKRPGD